MATPRMDMEQLKRDPESAFETPLEIVSHEGLSKEQKKEVLAAWEGLARARKTRPNVQSNDPEQILRQIAEAQSKLGADAT